MKFVTNCEVGVDLPADDLLKDFDAVVLCGGATRPRDLPIEGRNLKGIHFAMDFLTANTRSLLDSRLNDGTTSRAKDKDVIVIGGGDTGTDCVGTSMRHGCRSLRAVRDPAQAARWAGPRTTRGPSGPRSTGSTTAKKKPPRSSATIRVSTWCRPRRFVGDADGHVKELHTVRMEWMGGNGKFRAEAKCPAPSRCSVPNLSCCDGLPRAPRINSWKTGVEQDATQQRQGGLRKLRHQRPRCLRRRRCAGQSLVVWAINEGAGPRGNAIGF